MNLSRPQTIILAIIGLIILFFALGAIGVIPVFKENLPKTTIKFWGIDNEPTFSQVLADYKKISPSVTVEYSRFSEADYENKLIDALASGEGPDIFMFHSSWLSKHGKKVSVFPATLITATQFKELYPQVAEMDFIADDQIYALPLYIDTLALFYNRDTFDFQGVAIPPKTWSQFRSIVFSQGVGTDFGAVSSVSRNAADILGLLMLQSGVKMTVDDGKATAFASDSRAVSAVNFYTQFNPPKTNSFDSFSSGKIGMILDYQSANAEIKAKNPYLNLGIASAPQFYPDAPVNFASYYGLAVTKKNALAAAKRDEGWKLAYFIAAETDSAEKYLKDSNRPPALRSLVQRYSSNADLGVFAKQALSSRSWLEPDKTAVSGIFDNMILLIKSGKLRVDEALRQAQSQINQLVK
jgi:multiple sugar transport system substrate-binding protein